MIRNSKRLTSSIVLLVLCISTILSTLTSCQFLGYLDNFTPVTPQEIGTKEEISQNIDASLAEGAKKHSTVEKYLSTWGLPIYNRMKFDTIEACFNKYYNLEGGLPEVLPHAVETAKLFLENYYDTIDHNDQTIVTDSLLYCYVAVIGDPYSIYRPPVEAEDFTTEMSGKFGGIGVMVEYNHQDESIMVSTVYGGSPAEKAGLQVGDMIHAVDGVTIDEIGYLNAVYHIRGKIGTNVDITVLRNGEFVTVTATRAEVEEINVEKDFDPETKLAYISIVAFKGNTFDQFKTAVDEVLAAGAEGIVFDLRNNPGGYVDSVCDIISYIVPTGYTILSYQYKGKNEVILRSYDDGKDGYDHVIDLPMTVICNEYTASAGEIFTAAIRDYRNDGLLDATIVGVNSFGKGIMQNTYTCSDKSTVTLTVSYYNPPCGVNYHGTGVAPDVTVEITDDHDTQLDAAYEELIKLINNK